VVIVHKGPIVASLLSLASPTLPAVAAAEEPSSAPALCAALPGRDEALVEHLPREHIEDVEKLTERATDGEAVRLRGVTILVYPVEGLTKERLQRLVRCGLLRAAAADPRRPTDWPRIPPGTRVEVYSGGERFVVMLRAADDASAEELWRDAQGLKPSR
jgi:hypothetical protein